MTVTVSTTEYEFIHGKKPRGQGYWEFELDHDLFAFQVFQGRGFYSEVKKLALNRAKVLGCKVKKVLP